MDYQGLSKGVMTLEEAEKATILRCVVGSKAYGTSADEGASSDRDEMGILLEPLVVHLSSTFEQYEWRDAAAREGGHHNSKSQAGDLDLKLYSLWKFTRLALNGNPDVLMLLYASPLKADARGMALQALAPKFASQEAIPRFTGYLHNNRLRLQGQRGQKDVHRPDLVAKYGFDTKYAMQMVRLGLQGLEFVTDGKLTLPMKEADRKLCIDIRTGKIPEATCIKIAEDLEHSIKTTVSPLPEHPDREGVWLWVARTYLEYWKSTDFGWWDSIPNLRKGTSKGVETVVPTTSEGEEA